MGACENYVIVGITLTSLSLLLITLLLCYYLYKKKFKKKKAPQNIDEMVDDQSFDYEIYYEE